MERRVLLAIFLTFLVLYAYQALVFKPVPKPPAGPPAPAGQTPNQAGTPPPAPPTTPSTPSHTPAESPTPSTAETVVGETSERDIRIETRDVIATFTNRGGRITSWRLKRYLDKQKQPPEPIARALPDKPLPFSLQVPDEQASARLNAAFYTVAVPSVDATASPVDIRFEYRDTGGLHAVKEFHLEPSSYILTFNATVQQGDRTLPPTIVWGPAVGDMAEIS